MVDQRGPVKDYVEGNSSFDFEGDKSCSADGQKSSNFIYQN